MPITLPPLTQGRHQPASHVVEALPACVTTSRAGGAKSGIFEVLLALIEPARDDHLLGA
jgi:hypothetical protein